MIEPISRADDPRIADYAHVGDPTWLQSQGLFVAEGRLVVERLVRERRFAIRSVLLTPAALAAMGSVTEAAPSPIYTASQAVLNEVAGFNFHRGCLGLAERPDTAPPLQSFLESRVLVALEAVGNPDNVGGIFRNALAFGAGGVLLDPASGDPFYRKAIRTSMAATLAVPFRRLEPWPAELGRFKRAGFQVVALTPDPAAKTLTSFVAEYGARPLILVLGAEGPGLTGATRAAADVEVRIPIVTGVDSLNVTVAAGIALHAIQASGG